MGSQRSEISVADRQDDLTRGEPLEWAIEAALERLQRGRPDGRLVLDPAQQLEGRALRHRLLDIEDAAAPQHTGSLLQGVAIDSTGTWWRLLKKTTVSKLASSKGSSSAVPSR